MSAGGVAVAMGIGAVQGFVGGFGFTSNIVASAGVGGAIGGMSDYASQQISGNNQLDTTSLGIGIISGILGGGIAQAAMNGGATSAVAAQVAGAIAGGAEIGLRMVAPRNAHGEELPKDADSNGNKLSGRK